MAAIRKTITVTDQQDAWIAEQVKTGRFADDSALIRDLIRREQERDTESADLRLAQEHDRWFRQQVQAALDKAAVPDARWLSLDEAAARVRERARSLAKA